MLRHPNIDRVCCIVLALTLLVTGGYMSVCAAGLITGDGTIGYETRLFDQSRVHTIDIVMDGWDAFLDTAANEEYSACTIVIDGEKYANVAIRGKGNTSLSSVSSYGNDRYSFKVEFDHYQSGMSYHGLDKLSLNNLIQDPTCMKDYMAYTLMGKMGVASPLCSFVQISVNGEPWGLYLAVEGVEDSFLTRNYGAGHGELYKPDSMSFGGGRGNGRNFDMNDFAAQMGGEGETDGAPQSFGGMKFPDMGGSESSGGMSFPGMGGSESSGGMNFPGMVSGESSGGMSFPGMGGFGGFGMGSADVSLQYIDDDPASYQNIFNNAKTDVIESDKTRLIAALQALSDPETAPSVVNQDAVMRYFAVHHFLCNDDSYTGSMIHNYYLYEEDGVLSMIPWDYNLAFGGFGGFGGMGGTDSATSLVNRPVDELVTSGGVASRPMAAWIANDEDNMAAYRAVYAQMMDEVFASGWFATEFDRVTAMIAPYVQADVNGFFTYEEHTTAVAAMREFCLLRAESVTRQLEGTIPSTNAGQSADPSALVNASHLTLSDMGGMGGGMGGDRGGWSGGRGGERPSGMGSRTKTDTQSSASTTGMQFPADMGGMTPPSGGTGMQFPTDMDGMPPPSGGTGMQFPTDMDGMPPPSGGTGMQFPTDMGSMTPPDGTTGMQFPTDMGGITPPDGTTGMQFPTDMGGMTPPSGTTGMQLPTDMSCMTPPDGTTGMQFPTDMSSMTPPDSVTETAQPEATAQPAETPETTARPSGSGRTRTGFTGGATASAASGGGVTMLLISAAVLAAALFVASRYRSGR